MKIFISILFFIPLLVKAQCGNIGFDSGNNTGWKGYKGTVTTGPNNQMPTLAVPNSAVPWTTPQYFFDTNENPDANRWEIVSSGFDEVVPFIPKVSPWGGQYSCKLGNSNASSYAERLRFWPYTVTAQNCNLIYQYAVILENTGSPPHDMNEMPAFRVKFMTGNGQPISPTCGQYNIYSGQNGVGFQTYNVDANNSVSYRNWSMASVDLTPFIGQNIAIEFTTNDCSLGGHYGYAYIDLTCIAPTLSTDYCSGSPTAVVTAPEGYNAYSWTANNTINYPLSAPISYAPGQIFSTVDSIIVSANDQITTYSVSLIPYQGTTCAVNMNYTFNPIPTLDAEFNYHILCGNNASTFTDTSHVLNGGQAITNWHWDFGDGSLDSIQNPTHQFPIVNFDSTYIVSLVIKAGGSCADTIKDTITVPSGLKIQTDYINDVTCFGLNNGAAQFIITGVNNYTQYVWNAPSNPGNTDHASGIAPNTSTLPLYWFYAQNTNNSCKDSVSFTIVEPPKLITTVANSYITCAPSSASLTANITGGTQPYSILWDNGQSTPTCAGLLAGTYHVTVTDSNNCVTNASAILTNASDVKWNFNSSDITCFGGNNGNATLKVWGGLAPYSLFWNIENNVTLPVNSDSSHLGLLNATDNFVIIHNQNLCLDDTIFFKINQPDSISTKTVIFNSSCEFATNGSIKLTVVGGVQPYTYQWNNNSMNIPYVINASKGNYNVLITDNNGCTISKQYTIEADSLFEVMAKENFYFDSKIEKNELYVTTNKTGDYTYNWTAIEHLNEWDKNVVSLKEIYFDEQFRVDVTDEWGCTNFDTVTVFAPPYYYLPNSFTPNGDGINEEFKLELSSYNITRFHFQIWDKWGNSIFESTDPFFTWDGKDYPVGIYNWSYQFNWDKSKKVKESGLVTLIR